MPDPVLIGSGKMEANLIGRMLTADHTAHNPGLAIFLADKIQGHRYKNMAKSAAMICSQGSSYQNPLEQEAVGSQLSMLYQRRPSTKTVHLHHFAYGNTLF
jgi:hypothetical protein